MCPTIRIDDEVYEWLKAQAVPFDDTPNTVLRRLAHLDTAASQTNTKNSRANSNSPKRARNASGRRLPIAKGDELIGRWTIPAVQARFHRDGSFYEQPTRFPAALCDRSGYVVFDTEHKYKNCRHLKIGEKVNVPDGIRSIPGYQKVDDPIL